MMALQSCGSNLGHVIGSFVGLATDSMLFGLLWVNFLDNYSLIHETRDLLRLFRRGHQRPPMFENWQVENFTALYK